MKKIVFSIGFLFVYCLPVFAHNEWEIWRSTEIVGGGQQIASRVATGTIKLDSICVTSGSVGTSTFTYHSATSTLVDVIRTTSVVYNVSATADCWNDLDEFLPGGFFYTLSGTAVIRVKWNWTTGPPPGFQSVGLKTAQ